MFYGYDEDKCERMNFAHKLDDLRKTLNLQKMWDLRFTGKVLIIKGLCISKFVHLGSVINIPEGVTKQIEYLCYKFLWNGGPDQVKRSVMCQEYRQEGVNMVDIKVYFKSLQVLWVKRFLDCNDLNWKVLFQILLQ